MRSARGLVHAGASGEVREVNASDFEIASQVRQRFLDDDSHLPVRLRWSGGPADLSAIEADAGRKWRIGNENVST